MINNKWIEIAKSCYDDSEYHNFSHALNVLQEARKLISRCKEEGIKVNEEVVEIACLFHDAEYFKVENNKETHSAKVAAKFLKQEGRDELIIPVQKAILATSVKIRPKTVEEKILRAADLRDLKNLENFKKNREKLYCEYEKTHNKPNRDEFEKKSNQIITKYLEEEIIITKKGKEENFVEQVKNNIGL